MTAAFAVPRNSCPIHSCRTRIGTPRAAIRVSKVCLRSWGTCLSSNPTAVGARPIRRVRFWAESSSRTAATWSPSQLDELARTGFFEAPPPAAYCIVRTMRKRASPLIILS